MRLVDKDKLLEELIEGQKAGLGLILDSKYANINSIDDAIEIVDYADEIDLTEHDKQIRADERRKFAENLKKEIYEYLMEHYETNLSYISITRLINSAIAEYEKEHKNDR